MDLLETPLVLVGSPYRSAARDSQDSCCPFFFFENSPFEALRVLSVLWGTGFRDGEARNKTQPQRGHP